MKKTLIVFVAILATILAAQAYAAEVILGSNSTTTTQATSSAVFTRNLAIGDIGTDVMALQTILNVEITANIPVSGTFGSQTQSALITLQNKYPVDILIADGLSNGNGRVDNVTMAKLNDLAVQDGIHLANFTLPVAATGPQTINPFQRILQVGSVGDDVALLKQILNSDPATRVIYPTGVTGVANVFDTETADAVSRFQQKYASEILTPAGLTNGTGSVGSLTIKKLNTLMRALNGSVTINTSTSSTQNTNGSSQTQNTTSGSTGTGAGGLNCTYDTYIYGAWSTCTQGATSLATRTATIAFDCPFADTPALLQRSCDPTCTASTWTYGSWGDCNSSGIQYRTVTKTIDCQNAPNDYPTGALSQTCTYSNGTTPPGSSGGFGDTLGGLMTGLANNMDPWSSYPALDKLNTFEQTSGLDPGGNAVQSTIGVLKGSAAGSAYATDKLFSGLNTIASGDLQGGTSQIWDGLTNGFKMIVSDTWNQVKDTFNTDLDEAKAPMKNLGSYLSNQAGDNPVGQAVSKVVCGFGLFC